MIYSGHRANVKLGAVTIAYMSKYNDQGIKNELKPVKKFGSEWVEYVYSQGDGEPLQIDGWLDDEDTTGQAVLIAAVEAKTDITDLRIYYGSDADEFFHLSPGATLKIENVRIGDADTSGLIPVSFTLKPSGGCFERVTAYYIGTNISFTHVTGANNDTINKTSGTNFAGLGFLAGQRVIVEGSEDNDGNYAIYNVAANALTLTSDALTTESAGNSISIIAL